MILHCDSRPHRHEASGEHGQQRLSLIACLRRMGFYDPESLLGEAAAGDAGHGPIDGRQPIPGRLP